MREAQRHGRLVTKSKLLARTIAHSALALRRKESERTAVCLLRTSFRFLPAPGRYHLAMSQREARFPDTCCPESRSRFHPPLATRVFFPRGSGALLLVCATGKTMCAVSSSIVTETSPGFMGQRLVTSRDLRAPGALLFLSYDALLYRHDSLVQLVRCRFTAKRGEIRRPGLANYSLLEFEREETGTKYRNRLKI